MLQEVRRFFSAMRPAFSREATFLWFMVAFAGIVLKTDTLGVTSIIRALHLPGSTYESLLNFFHSTAWQVLPFMKCWWHYLLARQSLYRVNDRLVIVGDHTKQPKESQKVPALATLHEDSETSSKPSFFRGHHWGAMGLVCGAVDKFFCIPLLANIHEGLEGLKLPKEDRLPKTVAIVKMAQNFAIDVGQPVYLVLDAFFSVGPVFQTAAQSLHGEPSLIHILVRAKKSYVGYHPPSNPPNRPNKKKRKYGKKIKLIEVFETYAHMFKTGTTAIYNKELTVRYLTLDLLWTPVKGTIRFFFIESPRGRLIQMSSDLQLDALLAIQIYCRRTTIETMFNVLKHVVGGMSYHFWSKYLTRSPRRPSKKNKRKRQHSSSTPHTRNTLYAIEKYVNLHMVVIGILQLFAIRFPKQVKTNANCFLRTCTSDIPSEFVTRIGLAKVLSDENRLT